MMPFAISLAMKKILALVLLFLGLWLAYQGYNIYQGATADLNFLGLNLSLSDEEGQRQALLYGVGGLVCVLAALGLVRR